MSSSYEDRIISALKNKKKIPLSLKELYKKTGVNRTKKGALLAALERLKEQKKIIVISNKYHLVENLGLSTGEIVNVNLNFGFVRPENGERDVFIRAKHLMGAMPNDTVLYSIYAGRGRDREEGEVMEILQPADRTFSGAVMDGEGGQWLFKADKLINFPLRIHNDLRLGAKNGEKVLARIEKRSHDHTKHLVRIVEKFGDSESAAACCKAILSMNDIYEEFPTEALEQAKTISDSGVHPKELDARIDLRDEFIFTIDGADSKDLDDAVSIKKTADGWELGVHIADVSYFVGAETALDQEAFTRGTSVYYADSVVPMLPPELSNGICSLNPNEDRLTFSAIMNISHSGELIDFAFKKTVIRSLVKGVYSEVNMIWDGTADDGVLRKYAGLTENIEEMARLADVLTKQRYGRGGLNLESTESKIIVGANGKAENILPRVRGKSEMIIEEFMLTANEAAAKLAKNKGLPFVYRSHEDPSPDRIAGLFETSQLLGIGVKPPKGKISSAKLVELLEKARDTNAFTALNSLTLRAMAKAKYTANPIGHFGLALKDYAHFTSPIRRYPDLAIHRILSGYVTGMKHENIQKRYSEFAPRSAIHSTEREVTAMTAERACENCYKAEYMKQFIGEEFDGVVAMATYYGLYVQLKNTVEGLVPLSHMPPGNWEFDGSLALNEITTGKKIKLGDPVRVRVLAARVSNGKVDFALI